jgi:DNA-binding transcriptional ArsR family regulator
MSEFFGKRISSPSATQKEGIFVVQRAPCLQLLQALSSERRIKVMLFLEKHKRASVCVIAEFLGISEASTSRHLRILHKARLIDNLPRSSYADYRSKAQIPKLARVALKDYLAY